MFDYREGGKVPSSGMPGLIESLMSLFHLLNSIGQGSTLVPGRAIDKMALGPGSLLCFPLQRVAYPLNVAGRHSDARHSDAALSRDVVLNTTHSNSRLATKQSNVCTSSIDQLQLLYG